MYLLQCDEGADGKFKTLKLIIAPIPDGHTLIREGEGNHGPYLKTASGQISIYGMKNYVFSSELTTQTFQEAIGAHYIPQVSEKSATKAKK